MILYIFLIFLTINLLYVKYMPVLSLEKHIAYRDGFDFIMVGNWSKLRNLLRVGWRLVEDWSEIGWVGRRLVVD
jgi:hypothetical protein